ncbi:hypothetical protein [Erythrobacter dokdonensis]|uniref:DUF3667 domain-containing protein n=1 Tax=Erythrobacter dokdonensis DSW-74 TaxID=1300349 RepID=A0A1A7BEQ4_9SPHN|nr:hypothetical protein [Erythrobacter dokdonensis]OBV10964.1 hypothetical protein I603_1372 [Erythrobacter dokdonensis DSW-74]
MDQKSSDLGDYSADFTGFGVREWRTARDLVIAPKRVLEAWLGRPREYELIYARPLAFYLGLNSILLLFSFLHNHGKTLITALPPELLEPIVARSGKSAEVFIGDADNWLGLVLVPVSCVVYGVVAIPVLRWWDRDTLGWERGLRSAMAYLSAWTVTALPISWWAYEEGVLGLTVGAAIAMLSVIAFVRMGKGRWFDRLWVGLLRGAALTLLIYAASAIALFAVLPGILWAASVI